MRFEKIDKLSDKQIIQLHKLYQNEWWSKGRTLPDVKKMLRHTDIIFALCEENSKRLIAFARVLNDQVFKALILDVIVDPEYRSKGLGKEMMQMILEHPQLKQVKHFELYCLPALIPFYTKWSFTNDLGGAIAMRYKRESK